MYAGGRLAELATKELCDRKGLPMVFQLWIKDCPLLISSQSAAFGSIARKFTNRVNYGVFSIYTTKLNGQNMIPAFRLPDYTVTTFAGAGNFFVLDISVDPGDSE